MKNQSEMPCAAQENNSFMFSQIDQIKDFMGDNPPDIEPEASDDDVKACHMFSNWVQIEFEPKALTTEKKNTGLFLYVCQEDDQTKKTDQLSLFDNNRTFYPYNPKKQLQIGRSDGLAEESIPEYLDGPNRSWKKNIFSGAFYYLNYFDYQKVQ